MIIADKKYDWLPLFLRRRESRDLGFLKSPKYS